MASRFIKTDQLTPVADFYLEVARRNIIGASAVTIVGRNPATPAAGFGDLWGVGSDLTYPTSEEQWEVVSDSDDDTFGGIGAQIMAIIYMDSSYVVKNIAPILMNGTTPVILTPTDFFRPLTEVVIASGSNQTNVGNITVRVTPGGATRGFIFPGFSFGTDGRTTISSTEVGLLLFSELNVGKLTGAEFRIRSTLGDNATFGITTINEIFENIYNSKLRVPITYRAKTDIKMVGQSTGGGTADVTAVAQILLISDSSV